jgi:regulatory protein
VAPYDDNPADAFEAAVRILAGRDHSEAQLSAKLARRGFSCGTIRETLTKLRELKYIDDRRFARLLVRERVNIRARGRLDARSQLFKAGVPTEMADEVLAETLEEDDVDEMAGCRRAAEKKLASLREPDTRKRRDKLARHLAGRGFSMDCISKTLDALGKQINDKDAEDDLDFE